MKFYHGSPVPDIVTLRPNQAEHGHAVFLTDNETLAAIYAHPNHVWYTYCFSKEGQLVYDEVFPDQLRRMYAGHRGYVYTAEADVRQHERMPWVYMVDTAQTTGCTVIPDLYAHLLQEAEAGRLMIRRHEDMPERLLTSYRRMTVERLVSTGYVHQPDCEYAQFVQQYMPDVWAEAVQAAQP